MPSKQAAGGIAGLWPFGQSNSILASVTGQKTVPPPSTAEIFSLTSLLSLTAVAGIVATAYVLSQTVLPKNAAKKTRLIFAWHAFDAMVHFSLEGSFLFNCFFTWTSLPINIKNHKFGTILPMTPPGVHFLSKSNRLYGAFYGNSVTAKLWQEYAKADKRWGGSDLTVISLELLTVFVMAPLAVYVCVLLKQQRFSKAYFWMTFIATGELYGGFMTFAPEWLSGNPNLDGSNFMYLWVYLVFMNMLWVFIPGWLLYESYTAFSSLNVVPTKTAVTKASSGKKRS